MVEYSCGLFASLGPLPRQMRMERPIFRGGAVRKKQYQIAHSNFNILVSSFIIVVAINELVQARIVVFVYFFYPSVRYVKSDTQKI